MILDDLFSAATDFDTDKLAAIMHPEIRFSELPNLINPDGTERGFDEALAGFRKGRELLRAQTYDVHTTLVAGDDDRRAGDLARDAGRDGPGADGAHRDVHAGA